MNVIWKSEVFHPMVLGGRAACIATAYDGSNPHVEIVRQKGGMLVAICCCDSKEIAVKSAVKISEIDYIDEGVVRKIVKSFS